MRGLVIGAGTGGLLSSELLAKNGLDMTLFEMNRDVVRHFTGELTGRSTIRIVGEDCVDNHFSRTKVVGLSSHREIELQANHYLLSAERMKCSLLERAEAEGVDVRFGNRVSKVLLGNRVSVGNETFHGDIIVGAEGATSSIAKEYFPDPNYRTLKAIRYKIQGKHGLDTDTSHFYIDKTIGMGYLWVYPRSEKEFNLGVGSIDKTDLIMIIKNFKKNFPGASGWRTLSKGGGLIPYTGLRRPFAKPGLALVGNAAGQVSSFLGGGVEASLQGAICLARAVDKEGGLDPARYMEEFYNSYPRVSRAARMAPAVLKVYDSGKLFDHIEKAMTFISQQDVMDFVSEGRYLRPILKTLFLHPVFSLDLFRTYLNARKEMKAGL